MNSKEIGCGTTLLAWNYGPQHHINHFTAQVEAKAHGEQQAGLDREALKRQEVSLNRTTEEEPNKGGWSPTTSWQPGVQWDQWDGRCGCGQKNPQTESPGNGSFDHCHMGVWFFVLSWGQEWHSGCARTRRSLGQWGHMPFFVWTLNDVHDWCGSLWESRISTNWNDHGVNDGNLHSLILVAQHFS